MIKYDPSLLQSKSVTQMVILVLDLSKKMTEYHNKWYRVIKDDPNVTNADIVKDEDYEELKTDVKMLQKSHHKALNSLKNFNGKKHSEQLKYIFSGAHRDRYKMP